MALTFESEQRLQKVGLVDLFDKNRARWQAMAEQSHRFVTANFPEGAQVRPDDAAKVLQPVLEVDEKLINHLARSKLKQKYWIRDFCDLVLDRCWASVAHKGEKEAKKK